MRPPVRFSIRFVFHVICDCKKFGNFVRSKIVFAFFNTMTKHCSPEYKTVNLYILHLKCD